jgi:MFS family permease
MAIRIRVILEKQNLAVAGCGRAAGVGVWGLFPLFFLAHGLGVERIGVLKAVYPAFWGILQIVTGPLSDRIGRRGLVIWGLWLQAAALALTALTGSFAWWLPASALLGVGTAMVYPTLIAAVSDPAHPAMRARALSVYRFWRDLGYAVGALASGVIADVFGFVPAILAITALTLVSGGITASMMRDTAR